MSEIPTSLPVRNSKEWSTRGIAAYVFLMRQFLVFSPSYELARRIVEKKAKPSVWQPYLFKLYEQETGVALTEQQKIERLEDFNPNNPLATRTPDGDKWRGCGVGP